jgi:anti-sigma B factor antagonist
MGPEMSSDFQLDPSDLADDGTVIAVRGEVDLFTAPELKKAVGDAIDAGRTRVVVDLTKTTFLDSSGLGVLVGALQRLRDRGGALSIVNVDAAISRTFSITGLDQILAIRETLDDAIAALATEPA